MPKQAATVRAARFWRRTKKNRERAERAERILAQYGDECYHDEVELQQDYAIVDLVTDMLHLAASRGFDVDEIIQSARYTHFEAERFVEA